MLCYSFQGEAVILKINGVTDHRNNRSVVAICHCAGPLVEIRALRIPEIGQVLNIERQLYTKSLDMYSESHPASIWLFTDLINHVPVIRWVRI